MSLTSNALKKLQEEGQFASKSTEAKPQDEAAPNATSSNLEETPLPSSTGDAPTGGDSSGGPADTPLPVSAPDATEQPIEGQVQVASPNTEDAADPPLATANQTLPKAIAATDPVTTSPLDVAGEPYLMVNPAPAGFDELDKVTAELERLVQCGPESLPDAELEPESSPNDMADVQDVPEHSPVDSSLDEAWDELTTLANAKSLEQEVREIVAQDANVEQERDDPLSGLEPMPVSSDWLDDESAAYDHDDGDNEYEIVAENPPVSHYAPIIPSVDDLLEDVPELRFDADDTMPHSDTPTSDISSIRFDPSSEPDSFDDDDPAHQDPVSNLTPSDSDSDFAYGRESAEVRLETDDSAPSQFPEPAEERDESHENRDDDATVPVEVSPIASLEIRDSSPVSLQVADTNRMSPFARQVNELLSQANCRGELQEVLTTMADRCQRQLPQVLLVTSVAATSRTAEVLGLLAVELSKRGERVLLIDSNLRDQVITRTNESLGRTGFCDVLADCDHLDAVVHPSGMDAVFFVPTGDDTLGISREPSMLSESNLVQAIRHWEDQFDRILIDGGTCDSTLLEPLARNTQAALLLVPDHQLDNAHVRRAAQKLIDSAAFVVGCLLTDFPSVRQ